MADSFIPRAMADAIVEASRYSSACTGGQPGPKGFLSQFQNGVIIDEVQHVPELLSYIQGIVDLNPGRKFFLTGSSQFALLHTVTQSLAGRSAVFELLPLSLAEISTPDADLSTDNLMYNGFYPAIWSGKNMPKYLYPNYVKTYIERDVRDVLSIRNLDVFQRFVKLCAARIGSIFNASELSNELGVAVNTINSWISDLEKSNSPIVGWRPIYLISTLRRPSTATKCAVICLKTW